MENPYEAPETTSEIIPRTEYGGIGRLAFFGGYIVIYVAFIASSAIIGLVMPGNDEIAPVVVTIAIVFGFLFGFLALTSYRLKNVGMSPWWCLGMIVPILNIFVWFRCLICPEGYADTKKLDTAGKIVAGIILGLFALFIILLIVAIATSQ